MDLQLDVVHVPARAAVTERAHTGMMRARLSPTEVAHMADMNIDVTYDADDRRTTPGTTVLGLVDGKAVVVAIRRDDLTGLPSAHARGASWPASEVEAVGRVVEITWRP